MLLYSIQCWEQSFSRFQPEACIRHGTWMLKVVLCLQSGLHESMDHGLHASFIHFIVRCGLVVFIAPRWRSKLAR